MIDIEAIRKRAEAATAGPWVASQYMDTDEWGVITFHRSEIVVGLASRITKENAQQIAHAREDVPLLLQHIAEQDAKLATVRDEAMEECCRAVCDRCKERYSVNLPREDYPYFTHGVNPFGVSFCDCQADPIRRAFAEQEPTP